MDNQEIFCRRCGAKLPADSLFCTCCGEKVATYQESQTYGSAPAWASQNNRSYSGTSTGSGSATKSFSGVTVFFIIIACVLCGLLMKACTDNDSYKAEIESLNESINIYKPKADAYDIVISALKQGNLGKGNSGFYLDNGSILVYKGKTASVTLYANVQTTYHLQRVSGNSVSTSWDENWYGNTIKLNVKGTSSGATLFKISNDAGNTVIYFLVIVP